MSCKRTERNLFKTPLATVLANLILIYLLFFICHIVFIWYHWETFEGQLGDSALLPLVKGALRFDTAGIMYLTSPYIALMMLPLHIKERTGFYRFCKVLLVTIVSVGLFTNFADTIYYPFTGCRSTFQVFSEFSNEGGGQLGTIVTDAILSNWYLMLLFVAFVFLLVRFIRIPDEIQYRSLGIYYSVKTVLLCLCGVFCVVGIRGGWAENLRPITMSTAYQYANRPADAAAILNTPFCAIRTIDRKSMAVTRYYSEQELESIYSPVIQPDSTATFRQKNVVVLILESFGAEYIGFENSGVEGIHDCTPFLDLLMSQSMTFDHSMANGRKSIDAMPSVLSGIPMLKDHLFLTPTLMQKDVSGLAKELAHKGYYSAFFHGADDNSMGFRSYSKLIGYNDYFGREEFESEPQYGGSSVFDGVWAIWDEEFLQYMCDKIGTFREPFVASAFTATSHHPFNIPKRYSDTFPNEGNLPIYRTVRYSDHALELFFEKAKTQPWYKNTLFVLTADHTNLSEHPLYQSDYGQFRIPIIFFDPSDSLAGRRPILAQQSDILPSILGYLGYDRPFISFGQNIFNTRPEDKWVADLSNEIYFFYKGDLAIRFDGSELSGVYEFRKDPLLKNNVKGCYPSAEEQMLRQLKAIIQQYMEYMTEKELVISTL